MKRFALAMSPMILFVVGCTTKNALRADLLRTDRTTARFLRRRRGR